MAEMTLYIEEVDEDDPGPSVPDQPDLEEAEGAEAGDVVYLGRLEDPEVQPDGAPSEPCKVKLAAQTTVSRGGASLVEACGKLLVLGGADRTGQCFGDVHAISADGARTLEVAQGSSDPEARSGHTCVSAFAKVYMFGGADMVRGKCFGDLHSLDPETACWSNNDLPQAPPPRNSHSAVFVLAEATRGDMIVFAGASEEGTLADLWALEFRDSAPVAWRELEPQGAKPVSREMHVAAPCVGRMIMFGGRHESGEVLTDLWVLDQDPWRWARFADAPSPRCAHVGEVLGHRFITFGGIDGRSLVADCLSYDIDRNEWNRHEVTPAIVAGRFGHSSVVSEGAMLVFGGVDMENDHGDLHRFEFQFQGE